MVDWWRGFGDWGGLLWGLRARFVEVWWILDLLYLAPFRVLYLAPAFHSVPGLLNACLNSLLDITFINLPPGFYKQLIFQMRIVS